MSELSDKVQASIERIKAFEPPEGYFLAYSGGKDSTVLLDIAKRVGVKYDVHYSVTTVDPPELVRFIISQFDGVIYERENGQKKYFAKDGIHLRQVDRAIKNSITFDIPNIPMRKLIVKEKYPPTRIARYCCEELKETRGTGSVTLTGVRWAESVRRKTSHGTVTILDGKQIAQDMGLSDAVKRNAIVLNDDNDEARRTVELCYRTHKTLVNPIIDWTDDDIWGYIKREHLPYCKLYDEGFYRLGCIGCPMGRYQNRVREFRRYPAYRNLYIAAFKDMLKARNDSNMKQPVSWWADENKLFDWWIGQYDGVEDGQISIDEYENQKVE